MEPHDFRTKNSSIHDGNEKFPPRNPCQHQRETVNAFEMIDSRQNVPHKNNIGGLKPNFAPTTNNNNLKRISLETGDLKFEKSLMPKRRPTQATQPL